MIPCGNNLRKRTICTARYDMTKRPRPIQTIARRASSLALGLVGYLAYAWFKDSAPTLTIQRPDAPDLELSLSDSKWSWKITTRLAFSPDAALLFVGRRDGVLEVQRTADGVVCRELPLFVDGFVSLAFVGDSLWAMGGSGQVMVLGVAKSPTTLPLQR